MEMHHDPLDHPPRDAASVVLIRDGKRGIEVFLHQRHADSDVLGGAFVFPGGKRDEADTHLGQAHMGGVPERLRDALGEPALEVDRAAALFAAAIRESFEEAGILFAGAVGHATLDEARRLHKEGMPLAEVLEHLGLVLQADLLVPWSRWITPQLGGVVRKRFDTRFFLARPPAGQDPGHDNHEAVHSLWIEPARAIEQYQAGLIEMAPPQLMSLAHLSRHSSVDSAWQEACNRRPPTILPEGFLNEGLRSVCYPGDARHSVQARALPGPTRLQWRDGRFEPPPGFDPLLARA